MTGLARDFDRLANIERSFHVDDPWCGSFQLEGCHVRCALDAGDWLQLSTTLPGRERDAIRRQCNLLLPVKIVAGPRLIAEMPLMEDATSTFVALRSVLRLALAGMALSQDESAGNGETGAEVTARLDAVLDETAFTWGRDDRRRSTKMGTNTVVAEAIGTAGVFRANVAHLANGPSLDAVIHLVLAINARFRFVRGTFVSGRLVQEVALPAALLSPELVDRAVGIISDSCRRTKRACAALMNRQVAEQYLDFHTQGRKLYADTHD
jgi:hypothetical protein